MITLRPAAARGHADHGWLKSAHTFSFASYDDPEHRGFSVLRVLNEDRVAPAQGFGTHGHRDMEIVSLVLDGTLAHRDSMGHGTHIHKGEVQLMSAGSGVNHSEMNPSAEAPVHFLQMWVYPRHRATPPRYEQKAFPPEERRNSLRAVVTPDGRDGTLRIDQDATLLLGHLDGEHTTPLRLEAHRAAWLQVTHGVLQVGTTQLIAGDGAAITDEANLELSSSEDTEFLVWDLPAPEETS